MIFLFGERVHGAELDGGEQDCPVCNRQTPFVRVIETNYFTVFGIRLLPIDKVADYHRCTVCNNAIDPDLETPTHLIVVREAIAYIMIGYGMSEHREVAGQICEAVTGFEFTPDQLRDTIRELDAGKVDFFQTLKAHAPQMTTEGKAQVVMAAFLMTYVSCEIQHEDRVRVNLIGNALGVPLEFVNGCVDEVRARNYHGIRRLVPTGTPS